MIIQKQKPFPEILEVLEGCKKIYLIGCSECATACKVGGATEVDTMKSELEKAGKEVVGSTILEPACRDSEVRKKYKSEKEVWDNADAILVLACGSGAQTVDDSVDQKIRTAVDSLFVGKVIHLGNYIERCSTCGQCMLNKTEGICSVTRCAKNLLNGPCGGTNKGKCEISPDIDCAWHLIYEKMNKRGIKKKVSTMQIKNHSKFHKPRFFNVKKHGGK